MDSKKITSGSRYRITPPHCDWQSIPKPKIPVLPVLDTTVLLPSGKRSQEFSSPFLKNAVYTNSGRCAIFMALKISAIPPGSLVLLPAFHCLSMVAPVLAAEMSISFYGVNENLQINADDVIRRIDSQTRAVLVPHFFGFFQKELGKLYEVCKEKQIVIIEDCAHMLFERACNRRIGRYSDVAIASLMKFLPISEGGSLVYRNGWESLHTPNFNRSGFSFHFNSLKDCIQKSVLHGRLRGLGIVESILSIWKRKVREDNGNGHLAERQTQIFDFFDRSKPNETLSFFSEWVIRLVSVDEICKKRRDNYHRMITAFSGLSSATPLLGKLDENTVPYMFPLILKYPDRDFSKLKQAGVPMLRWEEMIETDDPVARYYSKHLVQIACHQSLSENEINDMIFALKDLV